MKDRSKTSAADKSEADDFIFVIWNEERRVDNYPLVRCNMQSAEITMPAEKANSSNKTSSTCKVTETSKSK